jgi:hypothetical protein
MEPTLQRKYDALIKPEIKHVGTSFDGIGI